MTTLSINNVKDIVSDIEKSIEEQEYYKTLNMIKIVRAFIKKKKLLLYGGLAMNMLLPKNLKFYGEKTMNDYDCYSKNAKLDAIELADIFFKNKYNNIIVKRGLHEGTYKVFVENTGIIDLTNMSSLLFDKLFEITLEERKTLLYKYYSKNDMDIYIAPYIYIKRGIYFEMSRPIGSYFRWEKIYKRFSVLNKTLNYENKNNLIEPKKFIELSSEIQNTLNIIFSYTKTGDYPIIDIYPIKIFKNLKDKKCCYINEKLPFLTIFSKNALYTSKEVVKLIEKTIDKTIYKVFYLKNADLEEIINKNYNICIYNTKTNETYILLNIINIDKECYSIKKTKGLTVGTVDSILYFLYSTYLYHYINNKKSNIHKYIFYYIKVYEKYIEKSLRGKNVKERLSKLCFGEHYEQLEELKKKKGQKNIVYIPK